MAPGRGVYIISVAAELAGVHPQTLRTYERKGLISPVRTEGGTRRYSAKEIERVRLIQDLTQGEGVNLAGVTRFLELTEALEERDAEIRRLRAENTRLTALVDQLSDQLRRRSSTEVVLYRPPQIERHPSANRRRRSG